LPYSHPNIRPNDQVFCLSLDRAGRSVKDLLFIVETITNRGGSIEFIKEGLKFTPSGTNAISNLMLSVLGGIVEFERSLIRERQMAGIKLAVEKHKFKGGVPKLSKEKADELRAAVASRTESIAKIARRFGLSRGGVYNYLKEQA
jgi:DNA invertase Pin-like site-specific DNA recombinase